MHELQSPRVELLHDIAADADFEARALNRSVIIDAPDSFVANVNGELIYRALENVIRNAVKHTAEGSAVVVRASTTANGGRLQIAVRDHGPGVPPDMLGAIFEPFVRVHRPEAARGIGLGLAIARQAVTAHEGTIEALLASDGGLLMQIAIPR